MGGSAFVLTTYICTPRQTTYPPSKSSFHWQNNRIIGQSIFYSESILLYVVVVDNFLTCSFGEVIDET